MKDTVWTLDKLPASTVEKLVEWHKPHGVYQKSTDGHWWVWRGKRGWLRLRGIDMIQKLEAQFD